MIASSVLTAAMPSAAFSESTAVAEVLDRFINIRSMSGDFVQFDSKGNPSEGTFSFLRPGMARFDYRQNSGLNIIADGKSVAVENKRLKTWNLYPLSKTPLNLLLGDKIEKNSGIIKYYVERDGLISIKMADQKSFGNSTIEILLDGNSGELRQWTLLDESGRDTTVVVHNIKINTPMPKHIFRIPYKNIRERN
jgi:outer membrane lipoprotein-sorting protein